MPVDFDLIDMARRKTDNRNTQYRVAAICFGKRNKFLGISINSSRFFYDGGGIHAEMAGLQKWGTDIQKMFIVRFGRGGAIRPINPCKNCNRVLNKLRIKVISISED